MLSTSYILIHGLRNTLKMESGIMPSLPLLMAVRPIAKAIMEELHPSRIDDMIFNNFISQNKKIKCCNIYF
jgi:hypothetical protein